MGTLTAVGGWFKGMWQKVSTRKPVGPPLLSTPGAAPQVRAFYRQSTTAGGNAQRWIVNNCTTCTLKNVLAGKSVPGLNQVDDVPADIEQYLRNLASNGFTLPQQANLSRITNWSSEALQFKFIAPAAQGDIAWMFNRDESGRFAVTRNGVGAYLAEHGFTLRLFPQIVSPEICQDLRDALNAGKPVLYFDQSIRHVTLYEKHGDTVWHADPLNGSWKVVSGLPETMADEDGAIIIDQLPGAAGSNPTARAA